RAWYTIGDLLGETNDGCEVARHTGAGADPCWPWAGYRTRGGRSAECGNNLVTLCGEWPGRTLCGRIRYNRVTCAHYAASCNREEALPLRMIQVGMGGWGQNWHLNILRPNADVEIVACVDSDPAMLAQAQKRLDLPAERCFGSTGAALDGVTADAVLITA